MYLDQNLVILDPAFKLMNLINSNFYLNNNNPSRIITVQAQGRISIKGPTQAKLEFKDLNRD